MEQRAFRATLRLAEKWEVSVQRGWSPRLAHRGLAHSSLPYDLKVLCKLQQCTTGSEVGIPHYREGEALHLTSCSYVSMHVCGAARAALTRETSCLVQAHRDHHRARNRARGWDPASKGWELVAKGGAGWAGREGRGWL